MLLLLLPLIFPSIRVFPGELALHIRWPKNRCFSFSISPSKEYSGLISFRIDLFDLLAVQEILKSLLQHHNLKASILQHSAFFMVQLSHLYMTTRKTTRSFPCGSAGKESTHNVGDLGSIPGLGRSSGEGKGYPLQYSGMENSMDCTVLGVAKSPTWLSDFHFHYKNHSFDYVDLCQQNDASAFTQDTSIQS